MASTTSAAGTPGVLKRSIPPGLPGRDSRGAKPGFSHVVEDTASGLIFTAGQIGVDENGVLVSEDQIEQFRETLRHIDVILEYLGLDRSGIMKTLIFTTDVTEFYDSGGLELFKEYFGEHPPVATLAGVTALARPEFKIEIEVVMTRSPEG
jgi:enamine deaminase RidA (YjgF/YER057c/UK114 family)